ncbi:uncharacterized protein LOC115117863 isoform X1 [Oncorhynchus nerka]|uniref:uncharacterized protein LOC115117863 isoform X1 n=1 Tax=Oncorhynchus nerka TaxID=8023 RepID=UPI0031B81C56
MKLGTKDSDSRIDILMKLHAVNVYEFKRHAVEQELLKQDHYRSMFHIKKGIRTVEMTLRDIKIISGYCHQTETLKEKPKEAFPNLSLGNSLRDFRKGNQEEINSILNLNGKCTTSLPKIRLDHTKGNAKGEQKIASSLGGPFRATAFSAGVICGFPSESGVIDVSISPLLHCNKSRSKSGITVIDDHRTGINGNGPLSPFSESRGSAFGTKDNTRTRVTTAMSKTAIKEGLRELVLEYKRQRTLRCFTPIYSPSPMGGVTPLMFVAQNRQCEVLKVLLQYGMLERRPTYIIISVLFSPPRLEALDERCHATVTRELRDCMALCFRVLSHVSMSDIEMQIVYGRKPLIDDWRDHIPPSRYKDPCELTHLCRMVVRTSLLARGRLPDGIKSLPLPTLLQGYLNLES